MQTPPATDAIEGHMLCHCACCAQCWGKAIAYLRIGPVGTKKSHGTGTTRQDGQDSRIRKNQANKRVLYVHFMTFLGRLAM